MKNMKKLLALVLALMVFAAALTGCGKTEAEPEETEAPVPVAYDSYYYFYDYLKAEYLASDVATYQAVTGTACELSALDWTFLEEDYSYVVEGYDDSYGIFLYAYEESDLEQYRSYLTKVGYICSSTERFDDGFSYYFYNASNEFYLDLFVAADESYVAIEPYLHMEEAMAAADDETSVGGSDDEVVSGEYGDCYYFYDYEANEYYYSDVYTYHSVTGETCEFSALDFGFLFDDAYSDIVLGYDAQYAVFGYAYNEEMLDVYCAHLEAVGFEYVATESYKEGTSIYYEHPATGYQFDLFVTTDGSCLVIEPYMNGGMQ